MPAKDNHVNKRGSSRDRRARKHLMLGAEGGFGGDGVSVPCWECAHLVTFETMVVDRIIPGKDGGGYQLWNVRPQCRRCAHRQADAYDYGDGWRARKARRAS